MPLSCHQREDRFRIVVRLLFAGRTRVFAVVCQFIHSAQVTDGVAAEEEQPVKTQIDSVNGIDVNNANQHL